MTDLTNPAAGRRLAHEQTVFSRRMKSVAVWLLIAVMAWAPFPLGGAIAWAAGLQEILVALCWAAWALSLAGGRNAWVASLGPVLVPLVLVLAVLSWALVQMLPVVPASWAHPAWAAAEGALGAAAAGTISIDPWLTGSELLKLVSYFMAGWLAYVLALRSKTAKLLVNAVIAIGAFYALYGFALAFAGADQAGMYYSVPHLKSFVSGPFMLHNSFAAFCGLAALTAIVRLAVEGRGFLDGSVGFAGQLQAACRFALGRGFPLSMAAMLCFAGVTVSASRAGFAATVCGLFAVALASLPLLRSRTAKAWTAGAMAGGIAGLLCLFAAGGDTLTSRFVLLLDTGGGDEIRLALWDAARRMIAASPWLGFGLGGFQDSYPLYETRLLPFVMDKAHSDYLELAAGLGLPAAIALWTALLWLVALCLRGVFARRRNRGFPLIGLGAGVLIGVHSAVDFSLQLPAVALLFAVLLGVCCAQSLPSRHRRGTG
jgi:O-antigen ligase